MTSPRRPHRLDGVAADRIATQPLPDSGLGRRGYDKHAVDAALSELADYISVLRVDLSTVTQTLRYREHEIEQRRHGVALPSTGHPGELIHEEQLIWHLEAQRYGDQVTAVAQVQAGQIVEDAESHARRILAVGEDRLRAVRSSEPHPVELLQIALHAMRQLVAQVDEDVDRLNAMAAELAQRMSAG